MTLQEVETYSYSHLLATIFVFAAFSNATSISYMLFRGADATYIETFAVCTVFVLFFSVLGQKISRINNIGSMILTVSVFSIVGNYVLFVSWATPTFPFLLLSEMVAGIVLIPLGMMGWNLLGMKWITIKKGISRKRVISYTAGAVAIGLIVVVFAFNANIVTGFFDTHPWVATLIGVVISLIGGIWIGQRQKGKKS
jgi:hypothetical protein